MIGQVRGAARRADATRVGLGFVARSNLAAAAPSESTRGIHSSTRTRSAAAAADTPLASTQAPSKKPFDSRLVADIDVPREASIVIVGGGVIGCSIASEQHTKREKERLEADGVLDRFPAQRAPSIRRASLTLELSFSRCLVCLQISPRQSRR